MIAPNQREGSNEAAPAVVGVFLAIEGPIGAGKTTLARLLHESWQAELVLEHFDENPFLPLFYADRQRYAWQTQLHFLIDRFDQWTELRPTPALRVSDYLFDKDRVFAELNLDGVALRRYLKVFHALRGQLRIARVVRTLHQRCWHIEGPHHLAQFLDRQPLATVG
jgi:deoxyadenosine/deoxycytidine kinase